MISMHRRVDYGNYFLYFSDDNQFGKENEGFWVKGRSTTDMVMRCWKPEKKSYNERFATGANPRG